MRKSAGITIVMMVNFMLTGSLHAATSHQPNFSKVDMVFSEWNHKDSPGCALAVSNQGKIAYSRGYGMANLENHIPIDSESTFYWASVSKQIVAATIALLDEEGRLSLDDDIRITLPEMPIYEAPITIRHLIYHTSGLRDFITLLRLAGKDHLNAFTKEEIFSLIQQQSSLNFKPGTRFLYSNSGYFLLGLIVERASGKPLSKYAKEKILTPLGMKHSHFHDQLGMIVFRRAEGYKKKSRHNFLQDRSRFALVGSGGLYSTTEDILRWDNNFYNNRLGKGDPQLTQRLQTPGCLTDGTKINYAFGLVVSHHRGLKTVRHSGTLGGYRAHLLRFPEEHLSVAIACNLNTANPSRLAEKVAESFLTKGLLAQRVEKNHFDPVDEETFSDVEGRYRVEPGVVIKVAWHADQLQTKFRRKRLKLRPVSKHELVSRRGLTRLRIAKDSSGDVHGLLVSRQGRKRTFAPKLKNDFRIENLDEYTGSYWNEDLDTTYRLRVRNGRLAYKIGHKAPKSINAIDSDVFFRPGTELQFNRDKTGKIIGFTLNAFRARHFGFTKIKQAGGKWAAAPQPPRIRSNRGSACDQPWMAKPRQPNVQLADTFKP
jgi:CubicO group peptidase (beta-lactamase class C family)